MPKYLSDQNIILQKNLRLAGNEAMFFDFSVFVNWLTKRKIFVAGQKNSSFVHYLIFSSKGRKKFVKKQPHRFYWFMGVYVDKKEEAIGTQKCENPHGTPVPPGLQSTPLPHALEKADLPRWKEGGM